jgi:hypothetical protein
MSTSSESLDFLESCEFPRLGVESVEGSGTCTDSGNGEVGRGFWEANAPVPKLVRVGVAASSTDRRPWEGAVLGLGVMADEDIVGGAGGSSLMASAARSGVLTGRNAAAMVGGACVG